MKKGDKVKFIKKYKTAKQALMAGLSLSDFDLLDEELTIIDVIPEDQWGDTNLSGSLRFKDTSYSWPIWWFEVIQTSNEYIEQGMKKLMTGVKDSMGKVSYREINWDFVTAMAKRLNSNKIQFGGKYEPNNWKKDIDLNLIEDALVRHMIAFINGTDSEESPIDHLVAIAVNCQIFHYHLTNNKHDSN